MGDGVGEERELFLTLLSPPPPLSLLSPLFPPETPDTQASAQSHKGEERGTISATIFPSPPLPSSHFDAKRLETDG